MRGLLSIRRASFPVVAFVLLAACATSKPPVSTPEWDAVPAPVVEGLCRRLQMDAFATGPLAIVQVTQPLANGDSLAALAQISAKGVPKGPLAPVVNRVIPIETTPGSCTWEPIDVREAKRRNDAMIVEVSSPLVNPFNQQEAGVFARVSLAGASDSWYWISLVPVAQGWAVRQVSVLIR